VTYFDAVGSSSSLHYKPVNPLNTELNPICHLLALLGAHHIPHISGVRDNVRKLHTSLGSQTMFTNDKYERFMSSGLQYVKKNLYCI
jgi:hypothetical protein